jgi:preprotein translocase subunit SecD
MRPRFLAGVALLLLMSLVPACSLPFFKRPLTWHITLQLDGQVTDRDAVLTRTLRVIESRLDALGLSNSEVKAEGDRILVKLPDVPNRDRVKRIITAYGRLEFVAVVSLANPAPAETYASEEEAIKSLGGAVPSNRRVLYYAERNEPTITSLVSDQAQKSKKWVVVESPAIVDGSDLRTATASQRGTGSEDYQILFTLTPSGAEKFASWTESHVNAYVGVVLNDEVRSIAYIKSQIYDQGEISGRFNKQSAEDLALVLRSGALPVRVKVIEEGPNK